MLAPSSRVMALKMDRRGVQLQSLKEVREAASADQRDQENDLIQSGLLTWESYEVKNGAFKGVLSVIGDGDVFIFATMPDQRVTIRDIVSFGQKVAVRVCR